MPVVLLFCIVGAFAVNNSLFGVVLIGSAWSPSCSRRTASRWRRRSSAWCSARMLEENFITSMIKSDGSPAVFFTRPIAGGLAIATFVILLWPLIARLWRRPAA